MENNKIKIGDIVSYISFGKEITAPVIDIKENGSGCSSDEKLLLDTSKSDFIWRKKAWVKTKNVKLIKKS